MPLHPQVEAVLEDVPRIWDDVEALTVAEVRAWQAGALAEATVQHAGVTVEELDVPGAEGPLRARVYRPADAPPNGVVLWLRGGGFVLGSLETERTPAPLARASGCAVVSVEYRLAPEHPFPAGLEDCYAALQWVADRAAPLGGHAGPVAVGGESAGGNLAAAVALLARDRGGPAIALQVLLVPMTARAFDGPSRHDPAVSPIAPPQAIEWLWRQYLGEQRDGVDQLASPLDAETLSGLPPALVITAEYDLLRDEGEAYADRLARDEVLVERHRYEGMHHGFVDWPGTIDAADDCIARIAAAVRRAMAR